MLRCTPRLLATFAAFGIAACVASGGKHFRTGEKAHDEGNLEAAEAAYVKALEAEPNNAQYKESLTKVRVEMSERYITDAKNKEKNDDWKGASEAWDRASKANPADQDLKARRGLSALKARNLGPDDWYEEVNKLSSEIPGNGIIDRTLAGARAKACQYHITLGDQLVDSGEGKKALEHYERAKVVDPATPGMDIGRYRRAQALGMMQDADDHLAGGDPISAYELYQKAMEIEALPEIKAKASKVKGKVSAVMAKLDQARSLADRGKHLEALRVYEGLAGTKGVPAAVESEVTRVKEEVSRSEAQAAQAAAKRGDLNRAQRSLNEAVKYSVLVPAVLEAVKTAIVEVSDGRAGKGLRTLEESGGDANDPVIAAGKAYATAAAKKTFEKARGMAKRDSAGALALISDLGPFEDVIPAIKELRRDLRAGSFQEMLDQALAVAKSGDDEEAGMLLLAALSASSAPAGLREAATEGADAIKAQQFVDAEIAFQKALAAEPRSRLAQRGIDIARLRRRDAEKDALAVLKSGSGDDAKAVETLARSRKAEPNNAAARQGAEALLDRVSSDGKSLTDAQLAGLFANVKRLSDVPAGASQAIDDGTTSLESGDHAAAETAFKKALESAPSLKLAKVARDLSRERMLTALKTGARRAAEGDDAAAKSLAELLKKDPNDREAQAALAAILDKADAAAKKGNDAEAAHQLALAAIATSPAPGVKAELDKATKAFAAGKMEDAEKAFADAKDLEPENPAAKLGHELAKAARVSALSAAVADAKRGGNVEQARAALERSLTIDPDGPEARKAFAELIEEARAQGKAGADRQAAGLLDAANVVSKPETARNAIAAANKLLGEGRHADAVGAYDKVLSGAESKVAAAGREIAYARRLAVLVAGAQELKDGGDLERGAKAVSELLEIDATNADAKAAIDRAMGDAERLAAGNDDKGAAKLMRAAARAAREAKDLEGGIIRFESGKFDDAEAELSKHDTELARRSVALVRQRKLGTLKAGLASGDRGAAESIKALLQADPTNKEAQAAFNKLLDKAKASAAKGDDKAAAEALEAAAIASAAPDDLAASLNVATTHLAEKRYAQAERGYLDAMELSKDSRVAQTGAEIAKKSRIAAEKTAAAAIAKPGDPGPHAKVLQASLIVEPASRVVKDALAQLMTRAKKAAAKPDDVEAAQSLDAAAMLENQGSDVQEALAKANALFAKGSFEEAETAFASIASTKDDGEEGNGARKSDVAELAAQLARSRRVLVLKAELETAKKDGDVLRQSQAVQKILELDASDRNALEISKKLKTAVLDSRLAAAQQQKEFGKIGVSYLYLKRALELDPANAKAKADLAAIEASLKPKVDLVVLIDKVARAPSIPGTVCKEMENILRDAVMEEGSKKTDLGAYILSKDWTAVVERGGKDAPEVGGLLSMTISRCEHGASVGKLTMLWSLAVPNDKGASVAKGALDADLPAGMLPRDEHDEQGKNARKALSKRAAKALIEKLEGERGAIDLWLLTLAEHAISSKDAALAAEAYARLMIKRPPSIDPVRVSALEQYLAGEFK